MAKENASKPRLVVADLTVSEKKSLIEKNLKALRNADDPIEKRNIRGVLRRLGHSGGLGEGKSPKKAAKKIVKNKRARKSATAPETAVAAA
jgi:hypothetical protein